jgi:hypothetical protein
VPAVSPRRSTAPHLGFSMSTRARDGRDGRAMWVHGGGTYGDSRAPVPFGRKRRASILAGSGSRNFPHRFGSTSPCCIRARSAKQEGGAQTAPSAQARSVLVTPSQSPPS